MISYYVANSILKKSFDERVFISPFKLYFLVYFIYSDYLYSNGKKLFNELFIKTENGPILPNLYYKFNCYGNRVIKTFAKNAKCEIYFVNDIEFNECLDKVWVKNKNKCENELLDYIKNSDVYINSDKYLEDFDILNNEIKKNELILKKAKELHTKI